MYAGEEPLALGERVSTLITRFSAGNAKASLVSERDLLGAAGSQSAKATR
jgi:hypothetical protein